MGWFLLAISAFLLLAVCRAWADRFGASPAERFWIGVAVAGLQLGTLAAGLSLVRWVTPAGWIAGQAVMVGASSIATRGRRAVKQRGNVLGEAFWSGATKPATIAIAAVVLLAFTERFALPLYEHDDQMYHGSRAAYWLQHASVLGFETHNPRQVSLPIAGDLWFFWPLLLTRNATAGQLGFGLGLPLCAAGMWVTLREAGAGRSAAALGAVAFCFTPQVLYHTRGLRAEPWATLYALGCAYWCLRAMGEAARPLPEPPPRAAGGEVARESIPPAASKVHTLVFAGASFGLAVSVKATMLPLLFGLLMLALTAPMRRGRALLAVAGGAMAGVIFGGFVVTAAYNVSAFGHPLGSRAFRDAHQADVSSAQLRTHAMRFALILLDPPVTPSAKAAAALELMADRFVALAGADAPLPLEERPWPGRYAYTVLPLGANYSLAGIVWVPFLLAALVGVARDVARSWPQVRLTHRSLLALLAAPTLFAAVFLIRWNYNVARFWLPAYALGLLVVVPMLERLASRRRWLKILCIVALVAMVGPAAWAHVIRARAALAIDFSPVKLDHPFFEPLAHIGDGATILLVATQDARDYPLFAPRRGFTNRVVPWGAAPFDEGRMRQLVDGRDVTFVLVQTYAYLDVLGLTTRDASPMVNWLTSRPNEFREIPLPYSPGMRLFARTRPNGPAATTPIR